MVVTFYRKNKDSELSAFKNIRIPEFVWDALWQRGDYIMRYTEPLPPLLSIDPRAQININKTATTYRVYLKSVIDSQRSIIGCSCGDEDESLFLWHVNAGWFE